MESLANLFRQMAAGEPAAWFLFVLYLVWPVMMLVGGAWLVYKDCRKERTDEEKKFRRRMQIAALQGAGMAVVAVISTISVMGLLSMLLSDEVKLKLATFFFTLLGHSLKT